MITGCTSILGNPHLFVVIFRSWSTNIVRHGTYFQQWSTVSTEPSAMMKQNMWWYRVDILLIIYIYIQLYAHYIIYNILYMYYMYNIYIYILDYYICIYILLCIYMYTYIYIISHISSATIIGAKLAISLLVKCEKFIDYVPLCWL